jgi:hypothetical protein
MPEHGVGCLLPEVPPAARLGKYRRHNQRSPVSARSFFYFSTETKYDAHLRDWQAEIAQRLVAPVTLDAVDDSSLRWLEINT